MSTDKIDLAFTSIRLEKIRVGAEIELGERMLMDTSIEVLDDLIVRHFALSLRGYLWGEKTPEKTIRYPRDWWEALKERWFPQWALKRWPVRYATHHIQFNVMYPEFKYALPKEEKILELVEWTR